MHNKKRLSYQPQNQSDKIDEARNLKGKRASFFD
jgi:hypothetical protein